VIGGTAAATTGAVLLSMGRLTAVAQPSGAGGRPYVDPHQWLPGDQVERVQLDVQYASLLGED
jgi:hypothetical protein